MWLCVKKLQWSHALTRVETLYLSATLGVEYSASMEPRTHARGNEVNELIRAGVIRASMEPRTHARGNQPFRAQVFRLADGFNGATHSRASKPPNSRSFRRMRFILQGSHALTRVEPI